MYKSKSSSGKSSSCKMGTDTKHLPKAKGYGGTKNSTDIREQKK